MDKVNKVKNNKYLKFSKKKVICNLCNKEMNQSSLLRHQSSFSCKKHYICMFSDDECIFSDDD
tara:strand:- start:66 stop:254 length:189 start_codon:yes stop_codon:yes gene_type:complete